MNVKHIWHSAKYSRVLTNCTVARKGEMEIHVHGWPWSGKVREVWYVPAYETHDGWRKAIEVPEDKVYEVIAATSHEHAMAIIREGESR